MTVKAKVGELWHKKEGLEEKQDQHDTPES